MDQINLRKHFFIYIIYLLIKKNKEILIRINKTWIENSLTLQWKKGVALINKWINLQQQRIRNLI